jgi:hypothetical protein
MKRKLIEHGMSIAFVTAVLLCILCMERAGTQAGIDRENAASRQYGDLGFVDVSDPFHKALLKDAVNIFYPGQFEKNNAAVESILANREDEFSRKLRKSNVEERLSWEKCGLLLGMFVKFVLVYAVVMLLTYYGVQTLAVFRFARKKLRARASKTTFPGVVLLIVKTVGKTAAYFVLFSPAYVIAYSIRTEFNTDTVIFMALLGVISNGLLVTYANKFYAFLVAESRKGYVETAVVKNLAASYSPRASDGIPYGSMFRPIKHFRGHVFEHIFSNAQHQYLSTIKEQASFLITGLIIIEMALNIHGHLSYEMLRQMLYKNWDIVIVIILGIFYTVKGTEIVVDYLGYRAEKRIENK